MRFLKNMGKHGRCWDCVSSSGSAYAATCAAYPGPIRTGTRRQPAVESTPTGCSRGHDIRPGDTCAWTIEGDAVEIHVAADGCAQVSLRQVGQDAMPSPALGCARAARTMPSGVFLKRVLATWLSRQPRTRRRAG